MWISRGANPSKTNESPKGSLGKNKVGPSKQSKRCVCCFPRRMQGVIRMPMSEKPADAKSCTTSSKSSETAESHLLHSRRVRQPFTTALTQSHDHLCQEQQHPTQSKINGGIWWDTTLYIILVCSRLQGHTGSIYKYINLYIYIDT